MIIQFAQAKFAPLDFINKSYRETQVPPPTSSLSGNMKSVDNYVFMNSSFIFDDIQVKIKASLILSTFGIGGKIETLITEMSLD